jgi:hypothetical protein
MAAAYLVALIRLAARNPDPTTEIAIPTGTVTTGELMRVVAAITKTRAMREPE